MELEVGKYRKSRLKRIITLALITILLSTTAVVGISTYVGRNLTRPVHQPIIDHPQEYNILYEDVTFFSSLDRVKLKGWWIPSQRNKSETASVKSVIFAHGYGSTRDINQIHILALAKYLAAEGYNVFLFDFRNSGESEGKVTSVGEFEKYDLLSAIRYVKDERKSEKIALMGWSMGAAVSITAGTESPDVSAIIADSPFADLTDYLKTNLSVWSGLPDFLFTPVIMNTMRIGEGIDTHAVSPYKAVAALGNRKLMLIHSKGDKSIPYQNSVRIFNAVPNKSNAEIWITEKADHIRTYLLQKEEYQKRVAAFLSRLPG